MKKILAIGALFAPIALAAPLGQAAPVSLFAQEAAGRARAQHQDSPSIALFVAQVRAEAERGPIPGRTLQQTIGRLVPNFDGYPRCLTPVTLEASRQSALSAPLTALAAPVLTAPSIFHETVLATPDGRFSIHYTLDRTGGQGVLGKDRDANGSPDYVDQVAEALAASREKLVVRLGYRDPQFDAPLDVYLVNLGGRIDGYTLQRSNQKAAALVIDSRLLGNESLLRAAVAHQYAHAVVGTYTLDAPIWWVEASTSWLEGNVVGSYSHYSDQLQAALDASAGGLSWDDARSFQGRLLWPAYLSSLDERGQLVRTVWEQLERSADGSDVWQATEQALRPQGLTLADAFSEYTLWLLLSGDRNDGRHFTFADRMAGVPFSGEYSAYPAAEIQTTPMLSSFGAAFLRFSADGEQGGVRINFEGASPGLFQAQLLLTPRKEDAPLVRAVVSVDPRGHGSIGIPWATFSEAVLIIGNVGRGAEPAAYSFFARPDPTFPFEVTAFSAQADGSDVRVTWETQSEDGLFGWIVYRSEPLDGAPRRVNDLIVPAIGDGDGPVSYQYLDNGVRAGGTYFYSLVGVTRDGLTREVPKTRIDLPR